MTTAALPRGITITALTKRYGDTQALAGLDLAVLPGQILGIAGPNGAGKSTLVRILSGEATPDTGVITIDGRRWTARDGIDRVAVVHQEPQLFPNLTVADNLLVGREGSRLGWPHSRPADDEILQQVGLAGVRDHTVGSLPLAMQQRVEIARALVQRADVFLFDEPNSALTEHESAELFAQMRALADAGRCVMLVSHRLGELAAYAQRVVIIIDGRAQTELSGEEISEERIARELVVGRSGATETLRPGAVGGGEVILELTKWTERGGAFRDLDLRIHAGEVLAIVGVEGSGGRELVRSVAGFERADGQMMLAESGSSRSGDRVVYLTGDRSESLFDNLSVGENLYLRVVKRLTTRLGYLRRGQAETGAAQAKDEFLVKAASLSLPIRSLSGGNQQKVAIAAALTVAPHLFAVEEPTRGVDLGSKAEIYRLLREFCSRGSSVLMYCTEDSEVFDVADRVCVMADGRIADVLSVSDYGDAESLAEAIAGLAGSDLIPAAP
ncbi:MAG: sugar ABC transporter ATP-binding protein [Actinomycetales bacterium]|nr:sugar ABC transporter ATP-binding protein [Actinomycetales bacterium]